MEKTILMRDWAGIKKMAQIVNPLVSRKATIMRKIAELQAEISGPTGLDVQIQGMEAGIKAKYGVGTEQLVKKVVTPAVHPDGTPSLDLKTGKQLTKTTWEPTELVRFDEENRRYILAIPEEGTKAEADAATSTEETPEVATEEATEEDPNNPFGI